ncbi:MAG: M15 family metallopeptidase [Clostridiales Family XIII bacterium]|nr:M15 family metallopeptidase [Clostridiales Family XIII bacterium]
MLLSAAVVAVIAFGVYHLASEPADLPGSDAGETAETGEAADTGGRGADTDADNPYADLYYYEADKQPRYVAYAADHPEMSPDQVVWQVDADLDKAPYTDVSLIEDFSPPLMVNKHCKLPDDFVPENLVQIATGQQMTEETKDAYEVLRSAATATGFRISAASAYRSIAYQKEVYGRYVASEGAERADTYSARPGHSEHHTGTTIDLIGPAGTLNGFTGTPEAAWVAENARRFGFIIRYTEENQDVTGYMPEAWHITWVGTDVAETMHEENIGSLEEYVVKYRTHAKKD